MNYIQIPDQPTAVLWHDETGNSGVIHEGEPDWDAFQTWLDAGNEPDSTIEIDQRSVETLRVEAHGLINASADAALLHITSRYPRTEIESWPEQCLESRAWLADNSHETPLLNAITGLVPPSYKHAFCEAVLSKANEYKGAVGAVIAWRRACTSWVETQHERGPLIGFAPVYPEVPHAS